jgi:hypothetical protein
MRREVIHCKSRSTAAKRCPWAAIIAKVEGGFIAFESVTDYETWRRQK